MYRKKEKKNYEECAPNDDPDGEMSFRDDDGNVTTISFYGTEIAFIYKQGAFQGAYHLYGFNFNDMDKVCEKVWYEILASSDNKRTSEIGKCDLIVKYIEGEQYKEAQKLLDTIEDDDTVDLSCQKKLLQAQVFEKTKREESAYEIYESMILKSANEIMFAVSFIIKQLCDEKKYDAAEKYIEILQKTCNLYDLDKISLFQSEMIISLHKKDKENAIKNYL